MEAAFGENQAQQQADQAAPQFDTIDEPVSNIEEAIEKVLGDAAVEGGIRVGCNQVIKAIEAGLPHYVFLAEDIEEVTIKKAVTLLAKQHDIKVIEVPSSKALGKWAGLCKIDREGSHRKIRGASCVALLKCSRTSQASSFLEKHVESMAA